eukprot:TRINITY_DN4250_c0_g5_i9.p2 TRINITY_DN4250_c0_g5~~TRINITY_DN4250_c0_g5_i9.p2  ORF type:complete len:205 (+),score=43.71 TRINITY_DN4250_c0_g5_i9:211-825(+)
MVLRWVAPWLLAMVVASDSCCSDTCNACYYRDVDGGRELPPGCDDYTGSCDDWFQDKNNDMWCHGICFAQDSRDCCQDVDTAYVWVVFFVFMLIVTGAVLACCFFCDGCPLHQAWLLDDMEAEAAATVLDREPAVGAVIYGTVPVAQGVVQPHAKIDPVPEAVPVCSPDVRLTAHGGIEEMVALQPESELIGKSTAGEYHDSIL